MPRDRPGQECMLDAGSEAVRERCSEYQGWPPSAVAVGVGAGASDAAGGEKAAAIGSAKIVPTPTAARRNIPIVTRRLVRSVGRGAPLGSSGIAAQYTVSFVSRERATGANPCE